jgi:hypothetical protein
MEPALLIGVLIMCTDWRMALDPQLGSLNYSDPPRPQRAKLRTWSATDRLGSSGTPEMRGSDACLTVSTPCSVGRNVPHPTGMGIPNTPPGFSTFSSASGDLQLSYDPGPRQLPVGVERL